jgi:hypothetical protein
MFQLTDDTPVFVISVAAQLSGLHPQTLRQYDRLGLVSPDRARVAGAYSARHVLPREVQRFPGTSTWLINNRAGEPGTRSSSAEALEAELAYVGCDRADARPITRPPVGSRVRPKVASMDTSRLTTSQQALAWSSALAAGNPHVEPVHLLLARLRSRQHGQPAADGPASIGSR